jgi:ectoine hydroxylase-related dioxygenase (phytanoyl-CoA dioxygenase family)
MSEMREGRGTFTQAAPATEARQRANERIETLDLTRNVAELDSIGYTVVEDAAPAELFEQIRDAIVEVTAEHRSRGVEPFNFGPHTSMVYRLLARRDVFARAALTPKLTALIGYLLGDGYVASATTGSILEEGAQFGPLHADNQFFPDPFPPQVHVATAIWCCDRFTGPEGSTHIVPGSNQRFRHPRVGEGLDEAVPVVAEPGSLVVWTGHTWHGSGARTVPGQRVALHTAFSRPHVRVFEAYDPEEIDRLVAFDDRFTRLVGADLPYDCRDDSPDLTKLLALAATTQAQA